MSDEVSFAELDAHHVELLASRTVLSMLFTGGGKGGSASPGDSENSVSTLTSGVTNLIHTNSTSVPPQALGDTGGLT